MFFLKSKTKEEDLLPPPPPFPSMELEEEKEAVSDELKPETGNKASEEEEFEDLLKDVRSLKPKKEGITSRKKESFAKKPKIPKKADLKSFKKAKIKRLSAIKLKVKKQLPLRKLKAGKIIKKLPKLKSAKSKKENTKNIDLIFPEEETLSQRDVGLPQDLGKAQEIELPDALEDFDMDKGLGNEIDDFEKAAEKENAKPREIIDAEDEIRSAIDKIKEREKPSLFRRLFKKKEKTIEKPEENLMPEISSLDGFSKIQDSIISARNALMRFDLETAKKNYIEIMKLYGSLKPEAQAKVYHDIRDLYFERKSAEELKV